MSTLSDTPAFVTIRSFLERYQRALVLAALFVLAVWPLLVLGAPAVKDGLNHFYRIGELAWHIQHGDLYPRWFSNLHYGFGAGVLNYYAPLGYFLVVPFHLLGLALDSTFVLGYALALGLMISGMFFWARTHFRSDLAGLAAAGAAVLSPLVYFNVLHVATYSATWGLGVAPWVFLMVHQVVRAPTRRNRLLLTLAFATLVLIHSVQTMVFSPLFALYGLWLLADAWQVDRQRAVQSFLTLVAGVLNAALIGMIFLIPFALEIENAQIERALVYDYHTFFLGLETIFKWPMPFSYDLIYNFYHIRPAALGWPQGVAALLALVLAIVPLNRNRPRPWLVVAVGVLSIALIFLVTPWSEPVWDSLTFLHIIQFPERLLAPVTALFGFMGAALVVALPGRRWQSLGTATIVVLSFFFSLHLTYHTPYDPLPDRLRPVDTVLYELNNPEGVGTTFTTEFLPRPVELRPDPETLLPRFEASDFPSRLVEVPDGVTLLDEQVGVNRFALTTDAAHETPLIFYQFYDPGWVARIDGQPVEIDILGNQGLMVVAVPAGQHELVLRRALTVPQQWGTGLAVLGLLLLFVPWPRRDVPAVEKPADPPTPLPAWMVAVPLVLFALRVLVLDASMNTPFRQPMIARADAEVSVDFGGKLRLLGYRLAAGPEATAGEPYEVQLYWQQIVPLDRQYQSGLRLVDAQGVVVGQTDNWTPGVVGMTDWLPESVAEDNHYIDIWPGAPPGEYTLQALAYPVEGPPFEAVTAEGPQGNSIDLTTITVLPGRELDPAPLGLLRAELARSDYQPGDSAIAYATWHTGDDPQPGWRMQVDLRDAGGDVQHSATFAPGGPGYPSADWLPHREVTYPHTLLLPADLPGGDYTLAFSLVDDAGAQITEPQAGGSITVTEPARSFERPAMDVTVDHDFAGLVRLLGYDHDETGLTLYFEALDLIDVPLTVFVHQLDAEGNYIAGLDLSPARPTTGWLPGEVITHVHPLPVEPPFQIGLYDATTLEQIAPPLRFD